MYKGKCVGRIIDFIREYCGCHISDHIIIDAEFSYIELHGQLFAIYIWIGDTDIPKFKFFGKFVHFGDNQVTKREYMIRRDNLLKGGE